MDNKKILELLGKIQPGQNPQTTFFDWITLMAMSIANSCTIIKSKTYEEREERFKLIVSRYREEEVKMLCKAMSYLMIELEENPSDILGEIYHELNINNKNTGQFFTPFHLSKLTASMMLLPKEGEKVILNEPSAGGGGMILASAQYLKENGIDYIKYMDVIAQDLDWNCVYMCYVQLSLAGINATVIQGDTLKGKRPEQKQIFYTPAKMIL